MEKNGIYQLPEELVRLIVSFMNPLTISKFSRACKALYELLGQERTEATKKHAMIIMRLSRARGKTLKAKRREDSVDFPVPKFWFVWQRDGPLKRRIPGILLAIQEGRVDVLRNYLEAGVDPNTVWGGMRSLLSEAACFTNMDCVKILLEYGADPSLQEKPYNGRLRKELHLNDVRTPLDRAMNMIFQTSLSISRCGHATILDGPWKPEYDAASRLIRAGVNLTHVYQLKFLLLQVNAFDVLKLAVEHGCDLSRLIQGERRRNVLHVFVYHVGWYISMRYREWGQGSCSRFKNDLEMAEWLVSLYPELMNARDAEGLTPFDKAIYLEASRPDIARLFLFRGIELGFAEQHDWIFRFTNGETDREKIERLLEIRQELSNYRSLRVNNLSIR